MIILDTSSLIRFFTNDDKKKAVLVKNLLKSEKNLFIPDVVFPELEYVFRGRYDLKKSELVDIFHFLSTHPNIKISQKIKKAVELFQNTQLDIADCIIAAHALRNKLASFDYGLQKIPGLVSYWQ